MLSLYHRLCRGDESLRPVKPRRPRILLIPSRSLLNDQSYRLYPVRERIKVLLSVKASLRAKEIALLTWARVTDAEGTLGDTSNRSDIASKGRGRRVIPINKDLRAALLALKAEADKAIRQSPFVVTTERAGRTSRYAIVNKFAAWYRVLGVNGP